MRICVSAYYLENTVIKENFLYIKSRDVFMGNFLPNGNDFSYLVMIF